MSASLRVICAGGFKTAMQAIAPVFSSLSQIEIELTFGTPARTRELVSAGSGFDVAVVTLGSLNDEASAQLDAATRFIVAKSPVGMGLREGLQPRKIDTPDQMASLLASLETIGLSDPKAGTNLGNDIIAAADRLGFGDTIRARAFYVMGPGSVVSVEVGKGKPDCVITLMSEILHVPGVQFLGPIPDAMGLGTPFVGAKALQSTLSAEALRFLAFLKEPQARQLMSNAGLVQV
jgi:molybdate transport system substrate-binding protein